MIYFKIENKLYNEKNIDKLQYDFIYHNNKRFYKQFLALYRIIKRELQTTLSIYPDIDIYVSNKHVKQKLGKFSSNYWSKEYNRKNKDVYIVLYWQHIKTYFYQHKVKGLKEVLYHEYIHFKQYLLNEKLGHYAGLKAIYDFREVNDRIVFLKKNLTT
jgi:hypothetical protein